jgi:hypothetical protein
MKPPAKKREKNANRTQTVHKHKVISYQPNFNTCRQVGRGMRKDKRKKKEQVKPNTIWRSI